MKRNYRDFVSFAITLQMLILLFGIVVLPVAAEGIPSHPLVLQGTVELDGGPAPINTAITAEVNGVFIGEAKVGQDGTYGDQTEKLYLTCEPDDYENIKFYVNGVEAIDVDILKNADPAGDNLEFNIVATSPDTGGDDSTGGDDGSNSGGSNNGGSYSNSGSSTTTTSDSDDGNPSGSIASVSSTGVDDASLKTVAATTQPDSTEDIPAPKTKTSMVAIVIGAIILIAIVAIAGYKLKEN